MRYRFIFFSWLLILVLQVVFIHLKFTFSNDRPLFDPELFFYICAFSIPFSIPGLFGLMLLVWLAKEFIYFPETQFAFIVFGCGCITIFCYLLFEFTLNLHMHIKEYIPFVAASLAAVFISLLITRKYYYSYINSLP